MLSFRLLKLADLLAERTGPNPYLTSPSRRPALIYRPTGGSENRSDDLILAMPIPEKLATTAVVYAKLEWTIVRIVVVIPD